MRWWPILFLSLSCVAPAAAKAPASLPSADSDPVVTLPPMLVEENADRLPWRYAWTPDFELLSVCDDDLSEEFASYHFRLEQLLEVILPARFQARASVPDTVILFNDDLTRARSREVIADMLSRQPGGGAAAAGIALPGRSALFMPNIRVSDIDATAVFAALKQPERRVTFSFTPERVAFLLERRTPELPSWFIEGVLGLYEDAKLDDDAVRVAPIDWPIPEEFDAKHQPLPPRLLPIETLLTRIRPKPDEHGPDDELWRAEATLFVRWAVVRDAGAHRDELWRFLDRLDRESLTEAAFRDCFGIGYDEAAAQLGAYLRPAERETVTLRPGKLLDAPEIKLRPATDGEIARIRGDWERMEIAYVKKRYPNLVPKYVEQARNTVWRAYRRGVRDPELLAVIGLLEVDAGNPNGARGLLLQAMNAHVARPRVYVELAKLRYDDVSAAAPDHPLDAAAVANILAPVREARDLEPPLLEAGALMADVWTHASVAPSPTDLAELNAVARDFPEYGPLALRVIYLDGLHHALPQARALAEAGWLHATDAETRARFDRIRHDLAALTAAVPKAAGKGLTR